MKIILASASPRRQELLKHIFKEFTVIPAKDEERAAFITPEQYVSDLAKGKAAEVALRCFSTDISDESFHSKNFFSPDSVTPEEADVSDNTFLIISADTIVYAQGTILGKPKDVDDAKRMLGILSGDHHYVYTGVCTVMINAAPTADHPDSIDHKTINEKSFIDNMDIRKVSYKTFSEKTKVFTDPLTIHEINEYIASGEPMDKAGSYGIQGMFSRYINHIEGDYFNVVGLPVSRLYKELKSFLPFCID